MFASEDNASLALRQGKDLQTRLLWLNGILAGAVLVAVLALVLVTRDRLEADLMAADRGLAQLLAVQLDLAPSSPATLEVLLGSWGASGAQPPQNILVLDRDGTVLAEVAAGAPTPTTPDWASWHRATIRQALAQPAGTFTSDAPAASRWLHATATTASGEAIVVVQRPAQGNLAAVRAMQRGLVLLVLVLTILGAGAWLLLTRVVIKPLAQLESFSALIRWRGKVRPDEQAQLDHLSERPDQLGSMARSLAAMERDIAARLMQLSTLLQTSRIVASSLDISEVIQSILDQVQQLYDVNRCAIIVLDRRIDAFRIRASRGLSDGYVRKLRIAPTEPSSMSMRALRNQEPIQVSDTETDLAYAVFRDRARAEGFRSVLAIPLNTRYAAPAVLLIYKSVPYRYSFSELELASSIANHASVAMDNAALFGRTDERLQEQTSRLESIIESLRDGLILESLSGQLLYCNQQAADLCGLPRRVAREKSARELLEILLVGVSGPDDAVHTLFQSSIAPAKTVDVTQQPSGGRRRYLRISLFTVTDADGQPLGRGQLWQDVTRDRELDRMKSALLSTVSHELRTPLASIKGYASTLLAEDIQWEPSAQRAFLETISKESDRLAGLVSSLLDMSRIEAGLLIMHRELYSLNDVLRQVLDAYGPALAGRVDLDLSPVLPPVPMDVPRIGTALRNLLDNAVKFSPPEERIEVTTRQQNGHVLLTVRDFGPGIDPDLRERVFDRFYRADTHLTRATGGTGLGLAICRGFVEAHGGAVWADQAEPGAVFSLSLPIVDFPE